MPPVLNIAAYRFVAIADPAGLASGLRAACERLSLKGTVLVAPEGINLFLAGAPTDVRGFLDGLVEDPRFADMEVKYSESDQVPFGRLRVRNKREIITFREHALPPDAAPAPVLAPERLRDWLRAGRDDEGRELVLLDTRNIEEVGHGSFEGALSLPITRFTELPQALEAHREALRGKAIVSFCTGGIRCEKAAPWMREAGYGEVWQLEGGILGYFDKVGGEGWRGGCFVFDQRVALDPWLRPLGDGKTGTV